jgi:hypothetical protein
LANVRTRPNVCPKRFLGNVVFSHPQQRLVECDRVSLPRFLSGTGIDIPVLLLLIDGDEKMLKVSGAASLVLRWEES